MAATDGPAAVTGSTSLARTQIRGGLVLAAGQGVAVTLGFVTQVLLVRYLAKSDYGAFAYALAGAAIAQAACTLGLNRTVARAASIHLEERRPTQLLGVVAVALLAIAGAGAVVLGAVYLTLGVLDESLVRDPTARTLLLIVLLTGPIQALDDLVVSLFAVFGRVRTIFLRLYVLAPGLRFVVVLLLISLHRGVRFVAFGYVVATAVGLAVFAPLLVRTLHGRFADRGVPLRSLPLPFRAVLGVSIPLVIADLTYILLTSIDALLLEYYKGSSGVAAFRAVQPAAKLNEIVAASFLVLFTPAASRLFARGDRQDLSDLYWRTTVWIALLTLPILVLTAAFASPLTRFLFGQRYASSGTILAVLALGYYVQVAVGFNGTVLLVAGRMRVIVAAGVLAVVSNVILDVVLIPRYGATGAAVGTTSAFVIHNLVKQAAMRASTGVPLLAQRYVRVYCTIAVATASAWVLGREVRPGVAAALALTAVVTVVALRVNRRSLSLDEMFPELRRLPFVRLVLGD